MRLHLLLWVLSGIAMTGCSSTATRTDDVGTGGADAAPSGDASIATDASAATDVGVDAFAGDDASTNDADLPDAVACACRSGRYHATGTGSGFSVDYTFDLTECGGVPVCQVGLSADALAPRPCMMTGDGAFRVYIDTSGFVQLVFTATPCDAAWTGMYASEGGVATITATRI